MLTLSNFEEQIENIILERGKNYWLDNAVLALNKKTNKEWLATVSGTETYHVKVELDNDRIVWSYCNCLYDLGNVCKHEVAVYFALRNNLGNQKPGSQSEKSMGSILSELSKEELAEIVLESIDENSKMQKIINDYLVIRTGGNQLITTYCHKRIEESFFPDQDIPGEPELAEFERIFELLEKSTVSKENIVDIKLFFIEQVIKFVETYGNIGEDFYDVIENIYEGLFRYATKNGLFGKFKKRFLFISMSTQGFGYGIYDSFNELFKRFSCKNRER